MIPIWVAVVVVVICLFIEAFFSGSEIALISADRALLRQKAERGEVGAELAQRFIERPQWLLATTLIGTNLMTVTAATIVTLTVIGHIGAEKGELVAVLILSPAILLFGEMVPKTFMQQRADKYAPKVAVPLRIAAFMFAPAVAFLGWVAGRVGSVLKLEGRRNLITRDELLMLLESSEAENSKTISPEEREIISNLLDAGDSTVYDIMLPLSELSALPEDATLEEAVAEFADKQHSRMPVYRERVDQIVGMLHAFDLLRAEGRQAQSMVKDIARSALYVPESKPVADLLLELQRGRMHMAVVVDEYGGATGIVTLEDILEQIVGDIHDEHDREPPPIRAERPGVWLVAARTSIEDVNRVLEIELPISDEYETVAGLFLDRLKRIPRNGEHLTFGATRVEVVAASERAIDELRFRTPKRRR